MCIPTSPPKQMQTLALFAGEEGTNDDSFLFHLAKNSNSSQMTAIKSNPSSDSSSKNSSSDEDNNDDERICHGEQGSQEGEEDATEEDHNVKESFTKRCSGRSTSTNAKPRLNRSLSTLEGMFTNEELETRRQKDEEVHGAPGKKKRTALLLHRALSNNFF